MKILYVITLADGGGAQQYTLALAKHFQGDIAAGAEERKLLDDARAAGLGAFSLKHLRRAINPWHDFLAVFEMVRLIKRLKPDIVHLNSTKAGMLGSIAGKLAGAKTVFTAHGFHFNEPLSPAAKRLSLFLETFASYFRDRIITVSQADYNTAVSSHVITPKKISVIHNGIAPINFLAKDEARGPLGLPPEKFIFGTIANFYPVKGLDALVAAVAALPAHVRQQTLFAIIGDGPERKALRAKIGQAGLEQSVKLLGKIPDAKTNLPAFDAFILPSRKEGFSFALLEALQAGLPIIATSVGGNPEIIGQAGILVKPQNPTALTAAIKKIFSDAGLRTSLAELAKKRSELFSEEKMLRETQLIYNQLTKPAAQ